MRLLRQLRIGTRTEVEVLGWKRHLMRLLRQLRIGTGTEVEVVLLCAASGTGLTDIADSLGSANRRPVVRDLENLVCTWHRKPPEEGETEADLPKMEAVARRPRRELYDSWRLACTQMLDDIVGQSPSGPAVMSLHLTWYNPDTSEFFSPIDLSKLVRSDCSIVHVVILVDDIYDMYYRLRGDKELYADEFMAHHRRMLKKLLQKTDDPRLQQKLDRVVQKQVIELALGDLLMWRRSEMIQAENMARSLGAKLTVLGTKHDNRVLQQIISNPDTPRIYLSHRITEHRRHNMSTRTSNEPLGDWISAVHEVNTLHQEFVSAGQVLINPTAIDELRFDLANLEGRRDPRLAKRWPMPEPEQQLLWTRPHPDRDPQHTTILTDDDRSEVDDEDVSRSIASSLANRIYFEIAFRDHVIVENTPNLCVYRPFFCEDMDEAESAADWSSGVNREIKHWKNAHRNRAESLPAQTTPNDDVLRRIAFVHTKDEIKCRMRWLLTAGNDTVLRGNARRHLEGNWRALGMTSTESDDLLDGKLPEADPSQLSRSPDDPMIRQKPKEVLAQIRPAAQIALYLAFASLNRPGTAEGDAEDVAIGLDQVAFYWIIETEKRDAAKLSDLVRKLSRFFAGDFDALAVTDNNKHFWRACDEVFEAERGIAFEEHVAQILGIDYARLKQLADQASQ